MPLNQKRISFLALQCSGIEDVCNKTHLDWYFFQSESKLHAYSNKILFAFVINNFLHYFSLIVSWVLFQYLFLLPYTYIYIHLHISASLSAYLRTFLQCHKPHSIITDNNLLYWENLFVFVVFVTFFIICLYFLILTRVREETKSYQYLSDGIRYQSIN